MCTVCTNLTEQQLEDVQRRYLAGTEPEKIACDYNVTFEDMHTHCTKCIKVAKSRFERLCGLIDGLADDVQMAQATYQSNPERADLAGAYAMMIREMRMTIESAQNLVKPEDQARELILIVLNPVMRTIVQMLTEEVSKLKEELISQGVTNDARATNICKARLAAMGQHLKRAMHDAVIAINKYYGVTVEETVHNAMPVLQDAERHSVH